MRFANYTRNIETHVIVAILFTVIFIVVLNVICLPFVQKKFHRVTELRDIYDKYKRDNKITARLEALKRMIYKAGIDCETTPMNCITEDDCSKVCISPKKYYFTCHSVSHLCIPFTDDGEDNNNYYQTIKDLNNDGDNDSKKNKNYNNKQRCSETKGLVAVLREDPQLNTTFWQCISLYSNIVDDNGDKIPGVCEGTKSILTLNVKAHVPHITDCVCSPDRTLITFSGKTVGPITSTLDIPRCVLHPQLYIYPT